VESERRIEDPPCLDDAGLFDLGSDLALQALLEALDLAGRIDDVLGAR
jgi:hypothetical protein